MLNSDWGDNMTIGQNIKRIREKKGISQKKLGEMIGVSQQMIGQYENSANPPKFPTIEKIAAAMQIPLYKFINDDLVDAAVVHNEEYENNLIRSKIASITDNASLNSKEKDILLKDLISQLEIVSQLHNDNVDAAEQYLKYKDEKEKECSSKLSFNDSNIRISQDALDNTHEWNEIIAILEKHKADEPFTEEEQKTLSDYIKRITSNPYHLQMQERRKKLSKDAESLIKTYSSLNAEDRAKVEEYAEMLAKFRKEDDGHTQ